MCFHFHSLWEGHKTMNHMSFNPLPSLCPVKLAYIFTFFMKHETITLVPRLVSSGSKAHINAHYIFLALYHGLCGPSHFENWTKQLKPGALESHTSLTCSPGSSAMTFKLHIGKMRTITCKLNSEAGVEWQLSSETGRGHGVIMDKALKTEYLILQRSSKG